MKKRFFFLLLLVVKAMKLVVKSCHVNAKRKPHEFGFGSVIMRKIPAAIANRLFCRLKTAAAIMLYSTLEKKSEVWSHFGMPKGIWQHTLQRSFFFFFVSICDYYRGELRSLGLRWNGLELWAHELMLLLHTIIPTCVWVWRSTKPISPSLSLHATT